MFIKRLPSVLFTPISLPPNQQQNSRTQVEVAAIQRAYVRPQLKDLSWFGVPTNQCELGWREQNVTTPNLLQTDTR